MNSKQDDSGFKLGLCVIVAITAFVVGQQILIWNILPLFYEASVKKREYFELSIIGATVIAILSWFIAKYFISGRDAKYMFLGAAIGVTIGFIGGFFGPMIFSPSSNQGPLLGIFITGPLGIPVGALFGFIYVKVKKPS